MTTSRSLSLFFLGLLLALPVLGQGFADVELLEPARGDLTPQSILAVEGGLGMQTSSEAVTFSRALAAGEGIRPRVRSHESASKEYWTEVAAADLVRGISLYTQAAGALVRVNPAPQSEGLSATQLGAIEPQRLQLETPGGKRLPAGEGMALMVSSDQLETAGSPFPRGTTAFRIDPALGAGTFRLIAGELASQGGRFVVHVLDQQSPLELHLRALDTTLLHGDVLRVRADLAAEAGQLLAIDELRGRVVDPSGKTLELPFRRLADGSYRGRLQVDASEAQGPGLWEVHAFARTERDGLVVERGARTAFAVSLPNAHLTERVEVDRGARSEAGLTLRFGVETASEARYQLRGLLFGRDAGGEMRPLALADTADRLTAGEHTLTLVFEPALFAASELRPPYEIRNLQLLDQGRMSLLQERARAVRLDE